MSGLAALFHRDGSPVSAVVLDAMSRALEHRGPDGCDSSRDGGVGLAHQHFRTTPEEANEEQPLACPTGRVWLAVDGRLDNRDDLLAHLSGAEVGPEPTSDAALFLAAYLRWGLDCFERCVGSFAVAIWDRTERRMVVARDALGNRSLFYHLSPRCFAVASEEAAVRRHPAVGSELDETRLAMHFAMRPPPEGRTFFRDVRELPPAHWLVVDQRDQRSRRYWHVEPGVDRNGSDEHHAERFLDTLNESVRCRLRSTSPPMVMMSGGLDSTSVVALASRHLRTAGGHPRLGTVSYVFDELPLADERAFMDPMTEHCGTNPIQFLGDDCWPLKDLDNWPQNPNSPEDTAYRWLHEGTYRRAAAAGSRVLLTGVYGDHLYAGGHYWLREMVAGGSWRRAFRETGWHVSESGLRHFALSSPVRRALVPQFARRSVAAWRRPPWLTEDAWRLLPRAEDSPPSARRARRPEQHRRVLGSLAARSASLERCFGERRGVDLRQPYRDRRLVELMLRLPADQLYRRGTFKTIARNAMVDLLPESVRLRRHESSAEGLFLRGLFERERERAESLLDAPGARWYHYVRPDYLDDVRTRSRTSDLALVLYWRCIYYELWGQRERASHSAAGPTET